MSSTDSAPLTFLSLNCTLKSGTETSSTDVLLDHIEQSLGEHGCTGERLRVANHDVKYGVTSDEGDGDGWPAIRTKILSADIFVLATPIWLGHPASVSQVVLERLDALLGETDDEGRLIASGRVAIVGVVGNEDGAHHVGAELFQGLNDVGFTIPAEGMAYWVGEAMQGVDFKDLDPKPAKTLASAETMVLNATHLARLLKASQYPAPA